MSLRLGLTGKLVVVKASKGVSLVVVTGGATDEELETEGVGRNLEMLAGVISMLAVVTVVVALVASMSTAADEVSRVLATAEMSVGEEASRTGRAGVVVSGPVPRFSAACEVFVDAMTAEEGSQGVGVDSTASEGYEVLARGRFIPSRDSTSEDEKASLLCLVR